LYAQSGVDALRALHSKNDIETELNKRNALAVALKICSKLLLSKNFQESLGYIAGKHGIPVQCHENSFCPVVLPMLCTYTICSLGTNEYVVSPAQTEKCQKSAGAVKFELCMK
jgi:hypothetical protein